MEIVDGKKVVSIGLQRVPSKYLPCKIPDPHLHYEYQYVPISKTEAAHTNYPNKNPHRVRNSQHDVTDPNSNERTGFLISSQLQDEVSVQEIKCRKQKYNELLQLDMSRKREVEHLADLSPRRLSPRRQRELAEHWDDKGTTIPTLGVNDGLQTTISRQCAKRALVDYLTAAKEKEEKELADRRAKSKMSGEEIAEGLVVAFKSEKELMLEKQQRERKYQAKLALDSPRIDPLKS